MALLVTAEPVPLASDADGVVRVGSTRVTLDTVVAAFREGKGLSRAELAERAGVHMNTVAKLELEDQEPAWPLVLALARAPGVRSTAFEPGPGGEAVAPPRGRGRTKKRAGK